MEVKQVGDITPGHNHADVKSFNELVEKEFPGVENSKTRAK
jgi:hypothetical protein